MYKYARSVESRGEMMAYSCHRKGGHPSGSITEDVVVVLIQSLLMVGVDTSVDIVVVVATVGTTTIATIVTIVVAVIHAQ